MPAAAAVSGPGSILGASAPLVRAEAGNVPINEINELDHDGINQTTLPFVAPVHAAPVSTGASLTFLNSLAIVLGLQIGSGIFSAPSQVSNHVSSPGVGVLVWLFAGLFVWTGAASFIELGLAIPINGGIQEYLRFCYGDFLGYLFTSTWVLLCKPAAMAMIAIVFSDHFCRAVFSTAPTSAWIGKAVAVLGLSIVTLVNCLGAKTGPQAANGFLVLKIFAIYSIVLIGIATILRGKAATMNEEGFRWFHGKGTSQSREKGSEAWFWLGEYVTAFYGALFCFAGWESIGFVAGEMEHPARDLPRVIRTAMVVVIFAFVFANIAFYSLLPIESIRQSSTVAIDFATATFGASAGLFYSLLVSISAIGTLNANVFATGRLCAAASKRRYFPAILANLHYDRTLREADYYHDILQRFPSVMVQKVIGFADWTAHLRLVEEVPIYAMMMNSFIACLYTVLGTFSVLVTFVGISEYIFFFVAVYGLRRVRSTHQDHAETAYRTWTANPIIFCVVGGILVIRGIVQDPWQGAFILLLFLLGWTSFRYRGLNQGR